jgi:hypothetical protein
MIGNYPDKIAKRSIGILLSSFILFIHLSAQGSFCPPGQAGFADCEQINCVICNLNGFTGSTLGYGADPDGDLGSFFCSTVQNVQYLPFIAGVANLSITVKVSNCTVNSGIDLGLMPTCDVPLNACQQGNGTNSTTIFASNLIVGTRYVLILDVDAGSACDFMITTNPANGTVPPGFIIPPVINMLGDFTVCPNGTTTFHLSPSNYTADVVWTAPPGVLINGQSSPVTLSGPGSTSATIMWGTTGGVVCATPSNPCYTGPTVCHNVTITPIPPTTLPPVTLCSEEAPFTTVWGQVVYATGNYSGTATSYEGCDSALLQKVTILPTNVHNSVVGLCKGKCINVCNENFCTPGNFTAHCTAQNGCDSLINLILINASPVAQIIGGGSLNCAKMTDTLSSANSQGVKTWLNSAGQSIGTGNTLVVQAPGTYFLSVTRTQSGAVCTETDTIVVPLDTVPVAFAGTMDTMSLTACGSKTMFANHHGNQIVAVGDSLIFILYSNPANPLGSVLEYSDMPVFPFMAGLTQPLVPYYVMAIVGKILPDHTIDFTDPCLSLSPGPKVEWIPKPTISMDPPPAAMCKGNCADLVFHFTGTPPFQFYYEISQNGQVVYSQNETANALQKTVTVCPGNFNPPVTGGSFNFKVNAYSDVNCNCSD